MGPKRPTQKPQAIKPTPSRKQNQFGDPKAKEVDEDQGIRAEASNVNINLQQRVLDIFKNSFTSLLDGDLSLSLQNVKQHLYNREFHLAFSRDEYLETYAVRWSSSRALAYLEIFREVLTYLPNQGHSRMPVPGNLSDAEHTKEHSGGPRGTLTVVCFGGGAGAELIALAGISRPDGSSKDLQINGHMVDIAAWNTVLQKLHSSAVTLPPLSAYASTAVKEANMPLADEAGFHYSFVQADVLDPANWENLLDSLHGCQLITLMFTLNELYASSMTKTTKLLMAISQAVEEGSLLLVVDSPGSYSTVVMAGSEKKYPMKWLLDHTLLETAIDRDGNAMWEKILSEDSRWFRLPQGLRYPIDLENMRYQIHLYQAR